MLIPSIDLMGGKIVQLVQGQRKALEFDNFEEWILRFSAYPLVQLIDLDAAIGGTDNRELLQRFTRRLPCQVGGGIRSPDIAAQILDLGAKRVILGSVLIQDAKIDIATAAQFSARFGQELLTFGVDSKGGRVAIKGWREITTVSPAQMMRALEPFCGAFLYTHIDTEGLLQGIPLETVRELRGITSRQLIVAGGIASQEEVNQLDEFGIDAVVGMAIYSGRIKPNLSPPRIQRA
jgi:phosphoribosylformimino-5-aminoimidazole carboxamide ribotide isomerase